MIKNNNIVNWLQSELDAFTPLEMISVSDWCDKYRVLDSLSSSEAGRWKTSRTPYLKEIMDSINDYKIEEISLIAGSQLGKTELLLNIIAYIIAHTPAPTMLLYPIEDLANYASENRIQPLIKLIDKLRSKYREFSSEKLNLKFTDMFLTLAGANSPAKLASKPIRFVLMDEVDKYPKWSGDEANPISLATERTKTFSNKKILKVSTPTIETGNIWQAYVNSEQQKQYYVPCPHCNQYQQFVFRQIKWTDEENVRDSAYYECVNCKGKINDDDKQEMLQKGKWQVVVQQSNKQVVRKVAYQINSIYSPFVTFGQVAEEFIKSKNYPELLMNFVNSWLGEIWQEGVKETTTEAIFAKQTEYKKHIVPTETICLTAGVDVQKDHFYYVVRAWGNGLTSWLVDYGRAETFFELERKLINTSYHTITGEEVFIHLIGMDSGYKAEEIYDFCKLYEGFVIPVKGASNALRSKYNVSTIDKGNSIGMKRYIVDTNQYKNFIFSRIKKSIDEIGSWNVFDGIDEEYASQICSEQLVEIRNKKTGQIKEEWQKTRSHADNHYLDCEVYSTMCADAYGVRDIYIADQIKEQKEQLKQVKLQEVEKEQEAIVEEIKEAKKKKEAYVKTRKNWLQR